MITFLQLDGVRGDVTAPPQYKGWIEVFAFEQKNFAVYAQPNNPDTNAKPRVSHTMKVTIPEDGSAAALQMASMGAMPFDSATIAMAEDNGAPKVTIKMTNVLIASLQLSALKGQGHPMLTLTLAYGAISMDQGHVPPTAKPEPGKARYAHS